MSAKYVIVSKPKTEFLNDVQYYMQEGYMVTGGATYIDDGGSGRYLQALFKPNTTTNEGGGKRNKSKKSNLKRKNKTKKRN
jgi:hypothetical protein